MSITETRERVGILHGKKVRLELDVLGKSDEGFSHPYIVNANINGTIRRGYMKYGEEQRERNGTELLLCDIGKLLGVSMADTVAVLHKHKQHGVEAIISLNAATCQYERYMGFGKMRDELYFDLKSGRIEMHPIIEMQMDMIKRRNISSEYGWDILAMNRAECENAVLIAPFTAKLYGDKHSINFCNLGHDYMKMLLFDVVTGQADRTMDNYGVIMDSRYHSAVLSPLFDNSTLNKPYMAQEQVAINHVIMDRKELLNAVMRIYGREAEETVKSFLKCKSAALSLIEANSFISYTTAKYLTERITKGFECFYAN